MKNSFKIASLALVIAASFAACKGNSTATTTDSLKTTDSVKTVVDTIKKDTTVKMVADTTKKDTTKK